MEGNEVHMGCLADIVVVTDNVVAIMVEEG